MGVGLKNVLLHLRWFQLNSLFKYMWALYVVFCFVAEARVDLVLQGG